MNIYQEVTRDIIAQLEAGVRPWEKTWASNGSFIPFNAVKKNPYRGINILILWRAAATKGYATHSWMGFREAAHLGAHVRKGEKATKGIYYKVILNDEGERINGFCRVFSVFNVAQLEGLPEEFRKPPEAIPTNLEEMVARTKIPVFFGYPQPRYLGGAFDRVEMPNFSDFATLDDAASTLFHEMSHATMAPSRLDRKPERTKDGYALEELLAELSAAFVSAAQNYCYNAAMSPAYLDGWLKVLKADTRAIVTLSSQASQIADWLLNAGKEVEQPPVEDAIPY